MNHRRYECRKGAGLCVQCGRQPARPDHLCCANCAAEMRKRRTKHYAQNHPNYIPREQRRAQRLREIQADEWPEQTQARMLKLRITNAELARELHYTTAQIWNALNRYKGYRYTPTRTLIDRYLSAREQEKA